MGPAQFFLWAEKPLLLAKKTKQKQKTKNARLNTQGSPRKVYHARLTTQGAPHKARPQGVPCIGTKQTLASTFARDERRGSEQTGGFWQTRLLGVIISRNLSKHFSGKWSKFNLLRVTGNRWSLQFLFSIFFSFIFLRPRLNQPSSSKWVREKGKKKKANRQTHLSYHRG